MLDLDPTALIASGAIVIFLTQQARRWIATDFLPLVALAIGIIIQLVNDLALAESAATSASVWLSVVVGAGVGMAAAGAYDLVGRAASEIPPAQIIVDDWMPAEGYEPADMPEVHQPDTDPLQPRRANEDGA